MSFRLAARIKTVPFDQNTIGSFALVEGKGLRTFRVTAYELKAVGANTITWKSGTSAVTPATPIDAGERIALAGDGESPLFSCKPNEDLVITLGAATRVVGWVSYTAETSSI